MATAREKFIAWAAPIAQKIQEQTGLPASIILGQAILESRSGESGLAVKGNNFFGIKGAGDAGSITMQTSEYRNGRYVKEDAEFRKYSSPLSSFFDHAQVLWNAKRGNEYRYRDAFGSTNYVEAAQIIQRGGYATSPTYAEDLVRLIQSERLDQYDSPSANRGVDNVAEETKKGGFMGAVSGAFNDWWDWIKGGGPMPGGKALDPTSDEWKRDMYNATGKPLPDDLKMRLDEKARQEALEAEQKADRLVLIPGSPLLPEISIGRGTVWTVGLWTVGIVLLVVLLYSMAKSNTTIVKTLEGGAS